MHYEKEGVVYTKTDIRRQHPDVSFPAGDFDPSWLGYTAVEVAPTTEVVSLEQRIREYTDRVQQRLDEFAATRGYDNILSACTYAASSVPRFASDGKYCVDMRDATWARCFELMAEVQAGTRVVASFTDIEVELPQLVWPS